MRDPETQYRIKKVRKEWRLCTSCKGRKTVEINLGQGIYKNVNCSTCDGTGVAWIEHQTEVTLIEALTELGIRFVLPGAMKPNNEQKLTDKQTT